ncbi:MAG TPA: Gfo/Idh/MocA family oxidoreductase [Solirubrobacteraceae bacterium]|nr:Gfo/Idh/MocA family oxidoreductase [Solirubrobacteraceae bacterium]
MSVGVVGLGYWGPNLARNLAAIDGCRVAWLCDGDSEALSRAAAAHPGARTAARIDDLLSDEQLDAVVLATPVATHAPLALRALEAGKHCLVEKPLATSAADAQLALSAAQRAGRVLMVGHLLEYHPAVRALLGLVDSGELGDRIYYVYSNRVNLGRLRADENALWSLGAHDLSVLLALAGEDPLEAVAHGACCVRPDVQDVVFCFLRFPSGLCAHLHLSWLDPHKERRFTVVGSRRMATVDDMALERKLTVYDKGFDEDARTYGEYITRSGGSYSPRIPSVEPLRLECEEFIASIRERRAPRTDGARGLRVVRVLERLQASLELTSQTRDGVDARGSA